jgi:hypothetical protein
MKRRYLRSLLVGLALVSVTACGSGPFSDGQTSSSVTPDGECKPLPSTDAADSEPLHLYVSNQSFDIDPVRIEVFIDEVAVICQDFDVGDQHNWVLFDMELEPGTHTIRAVGNEGGTELTETFDMDGERWAVIDFWYYSEDEGEGNGEGGQSLTFDIMDEPIGFA